MNIEFEFDLDKSRFNKDKHGIDFEEAQAIWEEKSPLVLPSQYPYGERELVFGDIKGKIWVAITTQREDRIRIISVRRARKSEIEIYDRYNQ